MANSASSNLAGARDSLSVLRVLTFFFDRFCTDSLSAPSGAKAGDVSPANQVLGPIYSLKRMALCESLSFGLSNRNFHALAIGSFSVVPTESKFGCISVKMLTADMMEGTHNAPFEPAEKAFASVHMGNAPIRILVSIFNQWSD